jgi:hypothetical protein
MARGLKLARQKFFRPGRISAMAADYKDHYVYTSRAYKTQLEYRFYLDKFVDKFGETRRRRLAPGSLRSWLREYGAANDWAGMHSLYRTIRAFFDKVRLCYDSVDRPGFVPPKENPAADLDAPARSAGRARYCRAVAALLREAAP